MLGFGGYPAFNSTPFFLAASLSALLFQKRMEAERILPQLIEVPSVNPAFLAPRHPCAGEQRVAEWIATTARRAGLDVELQPVLPNRFNVLARLSPRTKVERR